jgi:hypothetical protein
MIFPVEWRPYLTNVAPSSGDSMVIAVAVNPMAIAIVTAKTAIHMGNLHGETKPANAGKPLWFHPES